MSSELEERDTSASPASVARRLADDGVPLTHPDVLNADVGWRAARLFTAEELNFNTPAAAVTWMEQLSQRPNQDELRQAVLNIKSELRFVETSERTSRRDRQLAREIRQWLTIWLQNPRIFGEWFSLRQKTAEFLQLFGS